jgi:ABC-type multidrug transport system ATPase subunit
MEEADQLSDRILFLKNGEVRCVGTSYTLKEEFSSGFDVSVIAKKKQDTDIIIEQVLSGVPGIRVKSVLDRKIDFEVKRSQYWRVNEVLKLLISEEKGLKDMIEDWGVMTSTLEDVFFNLHASE